MEDTIENPQEEEGPNHPLHNITVSAESISNIIATILPDDILKEAKVLEPGKSFNNRVYFLTLCSKDSDQEQDAVLKVNGQFFGPFKIQNEVACLLLLESFCPTVPVPRVIAWSDDGSTARRLLRASDTNLDHASTKFTDLAQHGGQQSQGWILLSRLPGRALEDADLKDIKCRNAVMQQLARHVSCWRREMPPTSLIGNFKLVHNDGASPSPSSSARFSDVVYLPSSTTFPEIRIEGMIDMEQYYGHPVRSALEYYKLKLGDRLHTLDTKDVYARTRPTLSPLVHSFIDADLAKLPLFSDTIAPAENRELVFTQYDLAPRNVLVSLDDPSQVTGLVDFEFAGFFPVQDEFVNRMVEQSGDWEKDDLDVLVQCLEDLGVSTPRKGFKADLWCQASLLTNVTNELAPWWIKSVDQADELEEKLPVVMEGIDQLRAYIQLV